MTTTLKLARALAALILFSSLSGCAMQPPDRGEATVVHVVVCWLKNPGDAAGRERLIAASHGFRTIPGVVAVYAGPPLETTTTRPFVDASYDVMVVMTFDSAGALKRYESHPQHRQAVETVLKPLVSRFVVYDAVVRD